ncbi:MAG: gamma-glutamyl-gamma-aminobutyrate hydrolase family protein [Geminicoccaceae bacterium]
MTPLIGISCCRQSVRGYPIHKVGEKYITAVTDAAAGMPVLLPALGDQVAVDQWLERLDGLMLTGSPSNVEPRHYQGGPEPADNPTDPRRDETVFALIHEAVAQQVPLLAICRGIQELNVAYGGSLHQELHKVPGRDDHRSDKTVPGPERYRPRHPATLSQGGRLQAIFGQSSIEVNSLHGQGIDRLAPGLVEEALAPDGTIEAVSIVQATGFAVGVQWHPEWQPDQIWHHQRLFEAFGEACRRRMDQRVSARAAA